VHRDHEVEVARIEVPGLRADHLAGGAGGGGHQRQRAALGIRPLARGSARRSRMSVMLAVE